MQSRMFLPVVLALLAAPASAITIDWVFVGDPDNPPDTATNCAGPGFGGALDCGSVPYEYWIATYEVTNAQYAVFLNAKAAADPLGLYNPEMGSSVRGGITQSGVSGSFRYAVKDGFESKPVNFVSFWDALRFVNWLGNGQGSGDTETGAYTLERGTPTPIHEALARNPGALVFLPSENEWFKAAYHGGDGVFFDYPTGTDSVTDCVLPDADMGNAANCRPLTTPPTPIGEPTDLGAYALSPGPYGTFDQGGNVSEWNEQFLGAGRGRRGGSFVAFAGTLAAVPAAGSLSASEDSDVGFRVASLVPEPDVSLLGLASLAILALLRRRSTTPL